jgi:hypothetical protein
MFIQGIMPNKQMHSYPEWGGANNTLLTNLHIKYR